MNKLFSIIQTLLLIRLIHSTDKCSVVKKAGKKCEASALGDACEYNMECISNWCNTLGRKSQPAKGACGSCTQCKGLAEKAKIEWKTYCRVYDSRGEGGCRRRRAHCELKEQCETRCQTTTNKWGAEGTCATGCLSENDHVLKQNGDYILLKDVVIGDYIFDGVSFTKVLTMEYGPKQNMLKLFLSNIYNTSDSITVTMTGNHLLYDLNDNLVTSDDIKIGHIIFEDYVVNDIQNDMQYASTPYTFTGYLQVNGVKVSSYVHNKELAQLTHDFLWIFRWFSDNINEQIAGKILQQITYQRYYLKLKNIFGKDIMENKFWFYFFAGVIVTFITAENLLFSLISFQQIIFIAILIGSFAVISKTVLSYNRKRI